MLVLISDLHLTDGSSSATTAPGAFRLFARRLRELAEIASWRADGTYRPIDRIDLVLLGDILDVVRSARWATLATVRPWTNPHTPDFLDLLTRITNDILDTNDETLAVLRGLVEDSTVHVPSALRSGRPAADALQPVPVRIHYMVGNHDWFFHLPGARFDALRQKIIRQLGLSNRPDQPFPHDITEDDELLQTMRRHKVAARHGDLYDPLNFEGDRDTSSLGDAIVIELLNRFATEIEGQLVDELPASTVLGLREIDNVRPTALIPVWIDGLLERTCVFPSTRKRVKMVWDRLVDDFLAIDFVRQRDTCSPFDTVDKLQQALKFTRRLSVGWASSIAQWLNGLRGASCDSYYVHALAEQDFRNRRAKHIVYGHTHVAENVPLDASYAEGFVLNQIYFNAGTWRRVHRQTQLAPGQHEFIASDVMTYLTFYQGDERDGRPYETWSGALGYNPVELTIHRIDPGRATHAKGQSLSASDVHQHAPHFAPSPSKSGASTGDRL